MTRQRLSIKELQRFIPQTGTVEWIGIRPVRKQPLQAVSRVEADPGQGLVGDHYLGSGKRHVTLIDAAHLKAVASYLNQESVDPLQTRRNLVVRGINLRALKGREFSVGGVLLQYTGECHPCTRMEANLGPGGYNAMRGHGGICARILQGGVIRTGDSVGIEPEAV